MVAKSKKNKNVAFARTPRLLTFGSDFCGMDASSAAMARLFKGNPDKWTFSFASDKLKEAKALVHARADNTPTIWYPDVLDRETPPCVDVYVFSPPCQPFSTGGGKAGLADARGKLLSVGAKYIHQARPRIAILENVANLTSKKYRGAVLGLKKAAAASGYVTFSRVLDALDYGVPQRRRRFFLVYVRKDCYRRKFEWPAHCEKVPLTDILDPTTAADKPGRLPSSPSNAKKYVRAACSKVYKTGINPLVTPVAVDIDCSDRYQTIGVDCARVLTRARGGRGGPWITSRGRRTTINEMMRLQGFTSEDVPWQGLMSECQLGSLLGNSIPVPLIGRVLASALTASGCVNSPITFPEE